VTLAGKRIVVTRPRELAQGLAARIRQAGGEALLFPAIEIRDPQDPALVRKFLSRLQEFDLAVFVSPSAVRKALELAEGRSWPRVAAVGEGTRRELEQRGFRDVIAPAGQADSEALLALPELAQVAGSRVLILRGAGGRELLGETLAARGAKVETAECYRRMRPAASAAPPPEGRIDAVCVSSGEALVNLAAMLGNERLAGTPVFVSHPRVAAQAEQLGLRHPVLGGPGDADMLAALVAYFDGAK
jgi:uroporphyrinogen-III synthase